MAVIHGDSPVIHHPERHNFWLAAGSAALLAVSIWILCADHHGDWKLYQRQFRQAQVTAEPSYRPITVTDGGSLAGRITLPSPPRPRRPHPVTKDRNTCGQSVPDHSVRVDDRGGLRDVVVHLEGIDQGKPIDTLVRTRLHELGCRMRPRVVSVSVGQKIEVVNNDPILHRIHGRSRNGKTVFDISLPVQNQKVARTIRRPGRITLACDADHPWMRAHVAAFSHPYHAVTDEEGRFRIDRIPPGSYTLRAWHESLGESRRDLIIRAGEESAVLIDDLPGGRAAP